MTTKSLTRIALLVFAVALVVGCGGGGSSWVHVQPINAYRGYADFQPDEDKAVLAKAATVDLNGAKVRIFQEAFPPGIELKEGTFGVAPGYAHVLIGKFAYSPGKAVSKVELVAQVKKLAVAAKGDAAIIIFLATDNANFDLALRG